MFNCDSIGEIASLFGKANRCLANELQYMHIAERSNLSFVWIESVSPQSNFSLPLNSSNCLRVASFSWNCRRFVCIVSGARLQKLVVRIRHILFEVVETKLLQLLRDAINDNMGAYYPSVSPDRMRRNPALLLEYFDPLRRRLPREF